MTDKPVEIKLSSQRNPADELVDAFAKSKQSIHAVVYKFSEPKIFEALMAAIEGKDAVAVRLVIDKQLLHRGKGAGFIQKLTDHKGNVKVRKWSGHKLHAKFVIIDNQRVFSGSYNWTKGGQQNTELLLDFDDPAGVGRFAKLFKDLWKGAKKL